jgi:uncharacterized membrane protein
MPVPGAKMSDQKPSIFRRIMRNFRSCLISGILVLIPLAITVWVIRVIYAWTVGNVADVVKLGFDEKTRYIYISLISVAVLLVSTCVIGVLANIMIGRKFIAAAEAILMRIPVVKGIYAATKQVVDAVSLPHSGAFKAVVLLEFPRPGIRAVGFLTGTVTDDKGVKLLKLFIPMVPNLTSGFFQLVEPHQVVFTDTPVEEAFKMLLSGGIISPERFNVKIGEAAGSPEPKQ